MSNNKILNHELKIKPFVKWAGGKGKMLKKPELFNLLRKFDNSKMRYIEPFIGGGSVFFKLQPKNAIINDFNYELMLTYKILNDKVKMQKLVKRINTKYSNNLYDKDFYYKQRANNYTNEIEIAARFIFLNKTCFNGLYRVNKQNKFNVPMGNMKTIELYNNENFININSFLDRSRVRIDNMDFIDLKIDYNSNDFVYIDPPYEAASKGSSFTSYTKNSFNREMQVNVKNYAEYLDKCKSKFILHNFDNDYIRTLYKNTNFKKIDINISHSIGGLAKTRKKAKEIIFTNM